MSGPADGRAPRRLSIEQRLAFVRQRLAELRQGMPEAPSSGTNIDTLEAFQRRARDADQRGRQSVAYAQLMRQDAVAAFHRAALGHDRAAEVHERSARNGWGDVGEHRRLAEVHREAAKADRERAKEIQRQDTQRPPAWRPGLPGSAGTGCRPPPRANRGGHVLRTACLRSSWCAGRAATVSPTVAAVVD